VIALTPNSGFAVSDYRVGQLVQAHPATDTWMRGDRYGRVEAVGRKLIAVRMNTSKRLIKFSPDNLLPDE
jgi:hypothetical protein